MPPGLVFKINFSRSGIFGDFGSSEEEHLTHEHVNLISIGALNEMVSNQRRSIERDQANIQIMPMQRLAKLHEDMARQRFLEEVVEKHKEAMLYVSVSIKVFVSRKANSDDADSTTSFWSCLGNPFVRKDWILFQEEGGARIQIKSQQCK